MKKYLLLSFVAIFIAQHLYAQSPNTQKLDSLLQILARDQKFMGAVSVFKDGKEVYSHSVGYADIAAKISNNKNTKFSIGSITKTYTATLLFKAIEEGKVSLDQTIDKFFPTIKNANKITVAHLLLHRSGIWNFTDDPTYMMWNTEPKSRNELLAVIERGGVLFAPDSKMSYSNSNYLLISFILENIYSKSYAEILREKIIIPLALKHTTIGDKIDVKRGYCESYLYLDKWVLRSQTDASVCLGAGAIAASATDINSFLTALFSYTIVEKKSVEKMITLKDGLGMGLLRFPFYNRSIYGHGGKIDSFESVAGYLPDGNISYSIVSNGVNYPINDINIAVLRCFYNIPFDIPDFGAVVVSEEILDRYLGVYSSVQLPIKLTITREGDRLVAQGTGQAPFTLTPITVERFSFAPAKIVIEFNADKNTLQLNQGGGVYVMKR